MAAVGKNNEIRLWDLPSAEERPVLKPIGSPVTSVALSANGWWTAAGDQTGQVYLWDLRTGRVTVPFSKMDGMVQNLAFSADSQLLAAGSNDGMLKVWRMAGCKELFESRSHSGAVHCITFSPDQKELVTGSTDRTVLFWNIQLYEQEGYCCSHSADNSRFESRRRTVARAPEFARYGASRIRQSRPRRHAPLKADRTRFFPCRLSGVRRVVGDVADLRPVQRYLETRAIEGDLDMVPILLLAEIATKSLSVGGGE
jgi:hypothetical protein